MTDLEVRSVGLPLAVTRRYDGGRAADGLLGIGWTSSIAAKLHYTTYLFAAPSTYRKEAVIIMPDGLRHRFTENLDGTTYVPPPSRYDTLIKNGDGSFTLTLQRSRTIYQFDPDGRLLSMADEYANALNVIYDGSNRVDRITDAVSGRYLQVSYGGDGRINIIQDSAGRQVQYGYKPSGFLETVTDPGGKITTYSDVTTPLGPLLSGATDHFGRSAGSSGFGAMCTLASYNHSGETFTYTYNFGGNPNKTAKTDSVGNRYVHTFDADGLVTESVAPGGPISRTSFNPDGSIQQTTDEVGVKTFYTYDFSAQGRILTVTRDYQGPSAVRFDYAYDPAFPDKVTSITAKNPSTGLVNPDWQSWQYEYYQTGSPAPGALRYVKRVRSDASLETVASYVYNSRGQITQHTSATGGVTDYGYDGAANLTSVTGPANNDPGTRSITVYVPDPLGRVLSVTDPLGKTTSYTYDNHDRVLTVTLPKPFPASPLNFVTTYSYDNYDAASGLTFTHVTDANGRLTRQGYNAYGQLAKVIDPANNTTTYGYTRGLLSSITDANGNVTTYGYDTRRRLASTTFPNSASEVYQYWDDGLLKLKTDRKSQTITFNYDRHKRVQSKVYPGGGGSVTYGYIGQKLTSISDTSLTPSETHAFTYDTSYRVQNETQADRGTIAYTYNPDDSVASYTVTGGPTATYAYYPDGSLNTIVWSPVAGQFKYRHTLRGQYESITFPNNQTRNFAYDDQGRLTQLTNLDPAAANLATYAYGYDHNYYTGTDTMLGQRSSLTATVPSQGFDGSLNKYYYDPLYQLTRADYPNIAPFNGEVHQWTYDGIGNRLTNTVNASTLAYTYQTVPPNPLNWQRLLSDGENAYTYDNNGNTLTRNGPGGNFTFGWNADDRMTSITGAAAASYKYDYQGRRSSKTVGSTSNYLYRALDLIQEVGASPADYLFGLGIDEPLAISQGGSVSYYQADALGSVGLLADPAGTVQNSYVFDAWGVSRAQTEAVANPFTYTAREKGEAGSLFYRARYLSPAVGRFLAEDTADQVDPVSLNDRQPRPHKARNEYAYVASQPVVFRDPSGLRKCASGRCPDCPSGKWWSFTANASAFWWAGGTTGTTTYYCVGSPLAVTFTYTCWSVGMGFDFSLGASTGPMFGGSGCVCAEDLSGDFNSYEAGYGAGFIGKGGGFGDSPSGSCGGGFGGAGFGLSKFQRVNFNCKYRQFSYTPF